LNCILYFGDEVKKMRWARHVACVEEIRSAYRVMVEKPERKK